MYTLLRIIDRAGRRSVHAQERNATLSQILGSILGQTWERLTSLNSGPESPGHTGIPSSMGRVRSMYRTIRLLWEETALQLRRAGKRRDLAGLFQLLLFPSFFEGLSGFLFAFLFCISGFRHNFASSGKGKRSAVFPLLFF